MADLFNLDSNPWLSALGTPAKQQDYLQQLLAQHGVSVDGRKNVMYQMAAQLQNSIGLDKISGISAIPNTYNTMYKVTDNAGKQYVVSVPGTSQGDAAYVARPGYDLGQTLGNPSALLNSPLIRSANAAVQENPNFLNDWTSMYNGGAYISPYTEGMQLPEVVFDPNAYSQESFMQGIMPYLTIAAPAVLGAYAPGLFEGSSLANTGYIDALGGMTDASGTALSSWASGATGAGTLGGSMDWGDLFSGLGDTTADWLPNATGWDFGPLSDTLLSGGVDPVSGMTLSQMSPTLWDTLTSYVTNNPGSTIKTALNAMTGGGSSGLMSGALTGLGGYLTGNSAVDAARATADAQIRAAQIAADAAKFKPIGVTTNFGSSQFGYDANGNLTSAGYQLTPQMLAQQAKLMGVSEEALQQYMQSKGLTQPMQTAAQQAMTLGNNYLQTTPEQQAAKYMAEQQSLLAPSRERELALLQTKLANQGVGGLSMGATSTGMQAANPQLEAYYNALMQQDTQLAANATQGGMDYAKFGAGMVGTGGDLLKGMYGAQTAAYSPYQTALGGAQTVEGLGQNALTLGMNMGSTVTAANANAGSLLANGMNNAAQTTQAANAYSPWGALLTGAGNTMQNYNTQQELLRMLSGSGTSGWGT